MIDVSIIIVNYNHFQMTVDCIESIIEKTLNTSYEIILIDNASPDVDADKFLEVFPGQVQLIQSEENGGFAKGNNLGITIAKGEYVLLLNNDTLLVNDAITYTKEYLDNHPHAAVATCKLLYPEHTIQHNCQRFPHPKYRLFELLRFQKLLGKRQGGKLLLGSFFDHNTIVNPDWVWGTFFMFKKPLLETFPEKKLPETFFMYCEDIEWCMEFKKRGYKAAFNPKGEVIHLLSASGAKKNDMMIQNHAQFMKMYYSPLQRFLYDFLGRLL